MTAGAILEMLRDDIVSHGIVAQCLPQSGLGSKPLDNRIKSALIELLSSGSVDVGEAKLSPAEHVEFIAWKGSVEERVQRALDAVDAAGGPDKEFAYWLCLRGNVDRTEELLG
jgi:hypothetical protein